MGWLSGRPGAWRVALWVQPGAARTEPVGEHDGCLKLRLAARPIEGQANDALLRWAAQRLDCPRAQVTLAAGATSRRKTLLLATGLDRERVVALLAGTTGSWPP